MYSYKFCYFLNSKERNVVFNDYSIAITFFGLLIDYNIPFKVYTLQRRNK